MTLRRLNRYVTKAINAPVMRRPQPDDPQAVWQASVVLRRNPGLTTYLDPAMIDAVERHRAAGGE